MRFVLAVAASAIFAFTSRVNADAGLGRHKKTYF